MKVYPKIINENTVSAAERLVYEYIKLADMPGYMAFHSLLLPRHPKKYMGETDFLILSKKGILILEVKGGLIEVNRGQWSVTTEGGVTCKLNESPFAQAKDNMYAVLEDLKKAAIPFVYRGHLAGHGVIFPNCIFECNGLGIEQEIILDARGLKNTDPLAGYITQLEKYWQTKIGHTPQLLREEEVGRIKDWLRPKYYSVPSLRAEHISLERRMVGLLDEQMDFLETAGNKCRVICSGGAGTGKTLVGLEFARQKQQNGENAFFIVPNSILASYIKNRGYDRPWVQSLDMLKFKPDKSIEWLVIDESQDIMSIEGFEEIDRVLDGGIENGKWLLLCDRQNQSGIDGSFDPQFSKYLSGLAEAEIILPRNIRNTVEIIENTWSLTGKNIGKRGTGKGRNVDYIDYRDIQDAAQKVNTIVDNLLRKDLEASDILVIGKSNAADSALYQEMKRQGSPCLELNQENINHYPFHQPVYSSIRNCKGLESYVVVADLSEFGADEFRGNELYVSLTRPVGMLFLLYRKDLKKQIGEIQIKHLKKKAEEK